MSRFKIPESEYENIIEMYKNGCSRRQIGEKYGVTDNAIKKRCIKNGIIDEIRKYITSRKHLQ